MATARRPMYVHLITTQVSQYTFDYCSQSELFNVLSSTTSKFSTMTHIGPPNGTGSRNFQLLKIQDGGRPPCCVIDGVQRQLASFTFLRQFNIFPFGLPFL